MRTHPVSKMLIAASAIALANAPRAWSAPAVATPQTQPQAEIKTEAIALKHVSPSMMAFWLTPSASKLPKNTYTREEVEKVLNVLRDGTPQANRATIDSFLNSEPRPAQRLPTKNSGVFDLPEGVQSITPIDARESLLVRGTADGIAKVRDLVKYLDLPMRQVEVEVQTVRVSKADLAQWGIDFMANGGTDVFQLGFLRDDAVKKLQALRNDNGARVLMDARVTITNNLSSLLRTGGHDGASYGGPISEVQLTPTINTDNTITIVMESSVQMPEAPGTAATPGSQKIQTVANVRDGGTILLSGLDARESADVTLTFLTARIIRRADEKK